MQVTLGWKSAVVGVVLLVILAVGIFLTVRRSNQRDKVDWEREQTIVELQEKLETSQAEIVKLRAKADSFKDERDRKQVVLDEALAKLRGLRAIVAPTPGEVEQTCVACLTAVSLLEDSLRLAEFEVLSLREELDVAYNVIGLTQSMYEVQTARVGAALAGSKKQKRRNIWGTVGFTSLGVLSGVGIGRIGCH